MQAFTCQPLTRQTGDNPFTDSTSLATLVIPHLEAHLASHPEIRFLVLEFTPDHLDTVLAIRRIVGTSTLKIAAIIGSDNPSSLASSSNPSTSGPERYAFAEFPSVGDHDFSNLASPKASYIPAHRVNYVLPSSANPIETAIFIAAIRSSLCATSSFYTTDPTPQTNPPSEKATFLLSSASTSLDTPPASPPSTASPPIPPRSVRSVRSVSASPSTRASVSTFDRAVGRGTMLASPTSVSSASHYQVDDNASASRPYFSAVSVQTSSASGSGSESSRRRAVWGKTPRQQRRGWVSGTWGVKVVRGSLLEEEEEEGEEGGVEEDDIVEEEEDEEFDDVDERRLMPMYMARRRREKERETGGSGKAMRLLGLA